MLYPLVRPIATLGISLFFKKVHLIHSEWLPKNKPVILAVNHPTAFLEPCILACWLDRPLHFLVRGDFFEKKVFNFLLRALHMLPIYRKKDKGLRAVKDNHATFEACHTALKENKTLMILAEGSTAYAKRLRPLKKGIGRVAFGALKSESSVEEVYVVPIGVTFTNAARFRSEVFLSVGAPILASTYLPKPESGSKEAMFRFNALLYERLAKRMVLIEDPDRDEIAEDMLDMYRSHLGDQDETLSVERFLGEQTISRRINRAGAKAMQDLRDPWLEYRKMREVADVSDAVVFHARGNRFWETAAILLGAPFYALGWLFNSWPFLLVEWLVRNRVPILEFQVSIRVSVGIFGWLFWWLLVWIGTAIAGGPFWIPMLAMPLTGIFCVSYTDAWRAWWDRRKWNLLDGKEKEALGRKRSDVVASFQSL